MHNAPTATQSAMSVETNRTPLCVGVVIPTGSLRKRKRKEHLKIHVTQPPVGMHRGRLRPIATVEVDARFISHLRKWVDSKLKIALADGQFNPYKRVMELQHLPVDCRLYLVHCLLTYDGTMLTKKATHQFDLPSQAEMTGHFRSLLAAHADDLPIIKTLYAFDQLFPQKRVPLVWKALPKCDRPKRDSFHHVRVLHFTAIRAGLTTKPEETTRSAIQKEADRQVLALCQRVKGYHGLCE